MFILDCSIAKLITNKIVSGGKKKKTKRGKKWKHVQIERIKQQKSILKDNKKKVKKKKTLKVNNKGKIRGMGEIG